MKKRDLKILAIKAGCPERTIYRALNDIGIADLGNYSEDIADLTIAYLKVTGKVKDEIRNTLKRTILSLAYPQPPAIGFDSEFKEFLLQQCKIKDKQIEKYASDISEISLSKDKQIATYTEALTDMSSKLLALLDDQSMLRVQDTGTLQRLYDKNVLAELLTELEPGTSTHTNVELLLKKMNKRS